MNGQVVPAASLFCSSLGMLVAGISLYAQAQIPPPDFSKFVNASCSAQTSGGNQYLKNRDVNNWLYCCNLAVTVTIDPKRQQT
jgi:hypothetical protein